MATGDGVSNHERNVIIGECAAEVYSLLYDDLVDEYGLTSTETLQIILFLLQGQIAIQKEEAVNATA